MWFQNEGSLNELIVVELHERAKWKRTTIDDKDLIIPCLSFGASGALPQNNAKFYLECDRLGVLSRLNHTKPTFKRREVKAAEF